ncbi:hypothetical protein D0A38_19925 [Xanthomonas campestris pv. incanae]|nr:hypothetical protein D0A38_19925 [Xanthomonas campestris pv. incanae]RFF71086.1 hypothetical protein D0A39_12710 [Xanthomonas campestris pv. campestris]
MTYSIRGNISCLHELLQRLINKVMRIVDKNIGRGDTLLWIEPPITLDPQELLIGKKQYTVDSF